MTSRVPIAIVTILAIVSLCACSQSAVGDEVWGVDRAEFAARLAAGDHSLLETLPAEHHDPAEILRLGDDAAYAVGVISGDLERLGASAALLTVAWQRSPEPYRRAALLQLADRLRASGAHEELERLAVQAHAVYPDDLEVLVMLSGSIYLQADHRRVLDVTGAYAHSVAQLPADSPVRQEFALQRAVSRALIWSEEPDAGAPEAADSAADWQASFRALYADFPASPIHSRLWVFLIRQDAIRAAFTAEELRFFQAKQLVSEGRSREALDVLLPLARAVAAASADLPALGDLILGRHGVADLFRAGLAAGSPDAARVLEALAVRVAPAAAGQTLEYAGRIYRVAGAHAAAIRVFSEALELGGDPTARQALLWYRLSSTVRLSPVDAVTRLAEALPLVATPASFSAVFLDLADRLIALEEWRALPRGGFSSATRRVRRAHRRDAARRRRSRAARDCRRCPDGNDRGRGARAAG